MRDLRQGNDLAVIWSILRDGKPFNLSGKKLKLYLKNMYERREVDGFTARGNQIHWTFYGKDQKTTGKYSLILVANEDAEGMITTDTCDFVRLVSCTCKIENGIDSPNVEIETIELTSELEYVANAGGGGEGGSYDDTLLWEALNDKVDKVDGKGLSSNDFTDAYVEQLASLDDTYQPKGDYVETKNLATINGKPLNEGGDIKIEGGSGGGASIEVDDKLSTTSKNPVQNKVITAELNKKAETGAIPTKLSQLTDNVGFAKQADVEAGYQPKGDYVTDDELSSKGYATEKYVDDAIESVGEVSIDVDSVLSTTSENPVQNKVIYEALSTKLESEVVASSSPTEEIPLGYDDTEIWAKVDELSAKVSKLPTKEYVDNAVANAGGGGGSGDDTMTRILAGATPFICYKKTDGTIGFWDGYFVGTNHRQQTDIVEILFGGLGATPNASQFLNGWTNLEKIYPLMNGSGCTDLSFAFQNDVKLKDLSMLKEWDVSKVTSANSCFAGCAPEILPIENWDVSNLANMSAMFNKYQGIDVDFSRWTNNVVTTLAGFMRESLVKKVDLHNISTEKCTNLEGAMRGCSNLQWLDIRGWSCVSATSLHAMLNGCSQLTTLVGNTAVEDVIAQDIKVLDGYTATSNLSIKESSIPLNRASLRALINGLADMTETGATLPIGSANIAKLTNDDIAVATAKGWTIS